MPQRESGEEVSKNSVPPAAGLTTSLAAKQSSESDTVRDMLSRVFNMEEDPSEARHRAAYYAAQRQTWCPESVRPTRADWAAVRRSRQRIIDARSRSSWLGPIHAAPSGDGRRASTSTLVAEKRPPRHALDV